VERNFFQRLLHRREAGIFIALIGLVILITIFQPNFARPGNLYLVSRQIAFTAIIALGVFFVILTGGIDLSVGSVVGLSGYICGLTMAAGASPAVAVAAGLLTGAAVGAVNGAIVALVGVTPFIVTLGMLGVARGIVLVIGHGNAIEKIPESFIEFGSGSVAGLSVPLIFLLSIAASSYLILDRTIFGRQVYAIGGNEKAAALSGVKVSLVKLLTYVLSGVFSAVTGILFVARFRTAQADAGKGMELDAIAAAVIGGTSLMGGEGSVAGVLLGAIIMGVIRNGLVLMQVSSYWQELIIGTIIVLAAILDIIRSRKRP
jgi:ribose transport system permease protein